MFLDYVQRYFFRVITIILQIVVLAMIIRFFIISPSEVNGQSMEPFLVDQDIVLVYKTVYLIREPKRFEIVKARRPEDKVTIVKRVIGLPGEKIFYEKDKVRVITPEGEEFNLDEPYALGSVSREGQVGETEVDIPEHHYFLMGDNRDFSADSRDFGPMHRTSIEGRVIFVSRWTEWFKK